VQQLTDPNGYVIWIGLAGSTLYFSLWDRAIESLPSAGNGAPFVIAKADATGTPVSTGMYVFNGFAFDSTYLYWSESVGLAPSTIKRAPLGGGATQVPVTSPDGWIGGLAVDSGNLYWIDQDDGQILSMPVAGGATTTIATGLTTPGGLAIREGSIYLTDPDGDLMTVPVGGGAVTTLVHGPGLPPHEEVEGFPPALAVDDSNVYFSQSYAANPIVAQVPRVGGAMTVLAHDSAGGIAVDAKYVYWSDDSSVSRVPIGGGPICVIASNQSQIVGPALDESSVYWATSVPMGQCVGCPPPTGTNAIMKATK